jgi:hypothetical protein
MLAGSVGQSGSRRYGFGRIGLTTGGPACPYTVAVSATIRTARIDLEPTQPGFGMATLQH